MSFYLSSGTLDTMADVFSPAKKNRSGAGGGKGRAPKSGGAIIGFAVVSMIPKGSGAGAGYRASARTKQAFGGSNQAAVSRRAIATMERTARRVPEVMVRVTGRQHGGGHVLANFAYISRLGHGPEKELGLYTSEGEVIHDGREMQKLAQEWHEYEMGDDARRKGATSLSMILSMPTGTDPEKVKVAALDLARAEFANRSWVASLHIDRDHPHVHLTIARRDHDGRRFQPDRGDLFRYRQRFAEKLRERGIEANATPAKARGLDPKHEHIAARKVRARGGVPRLDKTRSARAERQSLDDRGDPVGRLLVEQRSVVRVAYERSIAELTVSSSLVNRTVAQSLQRFVDALPEPEPNSVRAVRTMRVGREAEVPVQQGRRESEQEDLAAATARLRAATERSRVSLTPSDKPEGRSSASGRTDRSGAAERPDEQYEPADRQTAGQAPDAVANVLRQIQERDRAHRTRDRDRTPDRGGPR